MATSAIVSQEVVELISRPTPTATVSQVVVEVLTYNISPTVVSQLAVEVITRIEPLGTGSFTITVPDLDGIGDVSPAGPGSFTIIRPDLAGLGGNAVTGVGTVTISVPTFAATGSFSGAGLAARLTQFGRQVLTKETNPRVRITQVARQVVYSQTCVSDTPPIDVGIVHIQRTDLSPHWHLERFDVKLRGEDNTSSVPTSTFGTPSWHEDGARWRLLRVDLRLNMQEGGAGAPNRAIGPVPPVSAHRWELHRFDIKPKQEEHS